MWQLCPGAPRLGLAANPVLARFAIIQPTFATLQQQTTFTFQQSSSYLPHIVYWLAVVPSLSTYFPPLPPLLRFCSPSLLSTSLVTPTSRRPINRHGPLSRTYTQA